MGAAWQCRWERLMRARSGRSYRELAGADEAGLRSPWIWQVEGWGWDWRELAEVELGLAGVGMAGPGRGRG
jgi:hypothetical protein